MKHFKECKTKEEIKSLYKELVKKYHPDLNPEGEETFKEIQKEYENLIENINKGFDINIEVTPTSREQAVADNFILQAMSKKLGEKWIYKRIIDYALTYDMKLTKSSFDYIQVTTGCSPSLKEMMFKEYVSRYDENNK